MASLFSPQLKRLLTYVRPYSFRLTLGVILVAFVALAEGGVALMIRLAVDFVLNPGATSSRLPLGTIPWSGRVVYLNDYFPARIHHVWTVFAISLVILFFGKAIAEYIGTMEIQHCGLAAVTDLRNQVYARVIRQPIGFFQHHPTGRLISTAINDVERVRYALSEWLSDLFQKGFTFVVFVAVLLGINWRMALGCGLLLPLVAWPVNKFGRKIRRYKEIGIAAAVMVLSGLGALGYAVYTARSANRAQREPRRRACGAPVSGRVVANATCPSLRATRSPRTRTLARSRPEPAVRIA